MGSKRRPRERVNMAAKRGEPKRDRTISMRVGGEYLQWVEEFCKYLRINDRATLLDQGLDCYAEKKGFRRPPPR